MDRAKFDLPKKESPLTARILDTNLDTPKNVIQNAKCPFWTNDITLYLRTHLHYPISLAAILPNLVR